MIPRDTHASGAVPILAEKQPLSDSTRETESVSASLASA